MIRAIIWDFGGTLFETFDVVSLSFQKALLEFGYAVDRNEIRRLLKCSVAETTEYYMDKYNLGEELIHRINDLDSEICLESVYPAEGLEFVLNYLETYNIKNFIISHRDDSLYKYIDHYNLRKYFTEIITSNRNFPRKPNSGSVDYIMERYSLNNNEVMLVGDRDCDIQCAKKANVKSVQVISDVEVVSCNPNHRIYKLHELIKIVRREEHGKGA